MLVISCLYFMVFCTSTYALYEDQIEKFDWRQQYLGQAQYYGVGESGYSLDNAFIATNLHVMGAVNLRNGSTIWRHALEEDGDFLDFKYCGQYIISVSQKNNILIRLWDAQAGYILGEYPISVDSSFAAIITNENERVAYILLKNCIISLAFSSHEAVSFLKFPIGIQDYDQLVAFSESNDKHKTLIAVFSNEIKPRSLAVVKINFLTNVHEDAEKTTYTVFEKPEHLIIESCLLQESVLVCIGKQLGNAIITSAKLDTTVGTKVVWSVTTLPQTPLTLIAVTEQHIVVTFDGEIIVVLLRTGQEYSTVFQLSSVGHVFPQVVNSNQLLVLKRNAEKVLRNINLVAYNLHSGIEESFSLLMSPFTLSNHHGILTNAALLPDQTGLLVFTEDHAIQLINKQGKQVWLREESLAHITAVEMIDLPVSAQQATMQEEFGNIDAGLMELFINRIRSQTTQLSAAFQSLFNKPYAHSGLSEDQLEGNFEPLNRDAYNLHKMIVIVTSVGKIFGLESSRGRIVWEYMVPNTSLFEGGKSTHLFQQRTTGHFPLQPVASVVLKSKMTGLPLIFFFDPILGAPLNRNMKVTVDKEEIEHESIVHVLQPLRQIVLVPGHVSEKTSHIRPLALILNDLDVQMLPESLSHRIDLLPSEALFIYAISSQPASVSGYHISLSSSSGYSAQLIWNMPLSSVDTPQLVVASVARPANEHVYSIGRVLGDRNVLYKYVNPNLLAVLTTGVSRLEKIDIIHLYLIDVVVGRIVHSIVHRRASLPVSLVVSENWVLYSVYNQRSLRSEFTILELFEPRNASAALVPNPWQMILNSLSIPTSSATDDLTTSKSPTFSSQQRAVNSARLGVSDGSLLIPEIIQRSFILSSPIRSGGVAVSITERGITAKSLLFGLETGNVVEISKSVLDPRRTLNVTPELQEEGLEPYAPELSLSTFSVISYNKTLERIRQIHTAPSGLESTSLVFVHGLDIFFTQIAPSKTYDLLSEDFDHWFIAAIVLGMTIASVAASRLAASKELSKAWQ